jgi:ribonuclease E
MTPILKRLAGLLGRAPAPSSEAESEADAVRRRRRRGGRGRGGSSNGSNGATNVSSAAPTPNGASAVTRAPAPARDRSSERGPTVSRDRSSDARRQPASGYDRRRAVRRSLDQPLPEDIAFRPPAEGGDRSILPSRRRPPPGLKATKRVLLAGSRFVPRAFRGGEDAEDEHEDEIAADLAPASPPANEATADGARARRRRRGRRGGRGRRRGGSEAATSES